MSGGVRSVWHVQISTNLKQKRPCRCNKQWEAIKTWFNPVSGDLVRAFCTSWRPEFSVGHGGEDDLTQHLSTENWLIHWQFEDAWLKHKPECVCVRERELIRFIPTWWKVMPNANYEATDRCWTEGQNWIYFIILANTLIPLLGRYTLGYGNMVVCLNAEKVKSHSFLVFNQYHILYILA